MWRLRPTVVLGALWAWTSVWRVRRRLQRSGLKTAALKPSPCPPGAVLGVRGVLTRLSPTCLEGALVWQAWLAARGDRRDVVIGVPPSDLGHGTNPAHAWVDGLDPKSADAYIEIYRVPAVVARP